GLVPSAKSTVADAVLDLVPRVRRYLPQGDTSRRQVSALLARVTSHAVSALGEGDEWPLVRRIEADQAWLNADAGALLDIVLSLNVDAALRPRNHIEARRPAGKDALKPEFYPWAHGAIEWLADEVMRIDDSDEWPKVFGIDDNDRARQD